MAKRPNILIFIFNPYGTVGLAPWGPADRLANREGGEA